MPAINSLTDQKFNNFDPNGMTFDFLGPLHHYELICFARHLGFPSPLLDWTFSYCVAAFFAFRDAQPDQDIAIFAYQDSTGDAVIQDLGGPFIAQQGSHVETYHRHYRQQSAYTVCRSHLDQEIYINNHHDSIQRNFGPKKVKKYILSSCEKQDTLEKLFLMNINDFTLFGDDDSLLRMLAYKEFNEIN